MEAEGWDQIEWKEDKELLSKGSNASDFPEIDVMINMSLFVYRRL